MQILPVIDLKGGRVVRGVAGRRDEYRPIRSVLAADARPRTVAKGLAEIGFREVYVADLDAIAGAEPDWASLEQIARCGLSLWLDAGLSDVDHARAVLDFADRGVAISGLIAGLESLPELELLGELLAIVGPQRLVFSLDLRAGRPLTGIDQWQTAAPLEIARFALKTGVRRMIVLDLARVGVGQGVGTEALCREIHELEPGCQLVGGGGVRGRDDLRSLARAGCQTALVASALHDGRLTAADVQTVRDT